MHKIQRTYWFSSAHQLPNHKKCKRLHGHNYKLEVQIGSHRLDDGMVMDFSDLDLFVKPHVELLDHRYIMTSANKESITLPDEWVADLSPDIDYSTAENLAFWFFQKIDLEMHRAGVEHKYFLMEVTVWETHRNLARFP